MKHWDYKDPKKLDRATLLGEASKLIQKQEFLPALFYTNYANTFFPSSEHENDKTIPILTKSIQESIQTQQEFFHKFYSRYNPAHIYAIESPSKYPEYKSLVEEFLGNYDEQYPNPNEITNYEILKAAEYYLFNEDFGAAEFYGQLATQTNTIKNKELATKITKIAGSKIIKDIKRRLPNVNFTTDEYDIIELLKNHSPYYKVRENLIEKFTPDPHPPK